MQMCMFNPNEFINIGIDYVIEYIWLNLKFIVIMIIYNVSIQIKVCIVSI